MNVFVNLKSGELKRAVVAGEGKESNQEKDCLNYLMQSNSFGVLYHPSD